MKKYLSACIAVLLAFSISAFTKPTFVIINGKKFTTAVYCYTYVGAQNKTERQKNTNYVNPMASTPSCMGLVNECAVCCTVTLDPLTGLPPANPDFTGATFNATTGMPVSGTGLVVSNLTKN